MDRRQTGPLQLQTPIEEWDLSGHLGAFGLSDVLQMLSFSGKTGTLTLIQGWNTRTISFNKGRICYIAAGTRLLTILDLLLRSGQISRAHLTEAARRRLPTENDVLRFLVAERVITGEDVQTCMERQLESTIYSLFLWRNCTFTYKADELPPQEGGVPVDLDSQHLIIEGTRRVDEWIEISPIVPSVFMIFQRRDVIVPTLKDEEVEIYHRIDGIRDVTTISQEVGRTQFETAKILYSLVKRNIIESVPPNKMKIIELFNLTLESIHMKLMMFGHGKEALEFQAQLNKFAQDNHLKVRMGAGRVALSDFDTPIDPTTLVDLYKLFIGIQNNKFSKTIDPAKAAGLMEGLYRNTDPSFRSMMRMYEFIEIEGLLSHDMFKGLRNQPAPAISQHVAR